jgi:hypothetical protein
VDQVPLDEIDLVVSFAGADKNCAALPSKAKVKQWAIPSFIAAEHMISQRYRRCAKKGMRLIREYLRFSWITGAT